MSCQLLVVPCSLSFACQPGVTRQYFHSLSYCCYFSSPLVLNLQLPYWIHHHCLFLMDFQPLQLQFLKQFTAIVPPELLLLSLQEQPFSLPQLALPQVRLLRFASLRQSLEVLLQLLEPQLLQELQLFQSRLFLRLKLMTQCSKLLRLLQLMVATAFIFQHFLHCRFSCHKAARLLVTVQTFSFQVQITLPDSIILTAVADRSLSLLHTKVASF